MEHKLNDKYNPKDFEDSLYQKWEESGYFKPSMDKNAESYCIMMPPPNVTGKLHMGHALDASIQDFLIRYKRMQGFNTLWLPGTDHAAISTEMKVVQSLREKGIKKSDLTREQFLEKAWEWTHEYGGTIQKQQRKMGCSCDWSRSRFTMDEGLSNAVEEVFFRLYEKGYIYKGKRMINWCPNCKTSISDAEVEYKEEASHIWHIKYPIKDAEPGTQDYLVVATTRPETMLGDTGVAVNPKDERYKHLIGKTCILPLMNKEIPIIADPFVDMEFGTGCVKLTPCHDPNDYQAGLKNNLEFVEVFNSSLVMNDLLPEVAGMNAYDARPIIVKMLEDQGYMVKIEDYTHNVAKCERCKTTIEPTISDQWFVKMGELAKPAIEAVRSGDIRFIPNKYDKTYFNWMENLQDWCISRQLYWGHRIPAYYCNNCGKIHVSRTIPEVCDECGCTEFTQDPDTLDTWFSSALWPFSTLGWPEETEDLKTFYPTNTIVTGYEIYKYNSKTKQYTYVGNTTKTTYTVKNLKPGTTYKYKVRAYIKNDGNLGAGASTSKVDGFFSSELSATTKTETPKISKITTKSKKATIKWSKTSGASGYEIYMSTSKNGKYSKIGTVKGNKTFKYTKSKLKKEKKYFFKIRTYRTVAGKKVYSSYSSIKNIKVK